MPNEDFKNALALKKVGEMSLPTTIEKKRMESLLIICCARRRSRGTDLNEVGCRSLVIICLQWCPCASDGWSGL
jgi:hypothetical protein